MAVDKALSDISLATLTFLMAIPVFFAVGPRLESSLFPVVENIRVEVQDIVGGETRVRVSFDKVRNCEFREVAWGSKDGSRVRVQFEEDATDYPLSRPVTNHKTGPWVLGTSNIENTQAVVRHKCHPLWVTETHFYP